MYWLTWAIFFGGPLSNCRTPLVLEILTNPQIQRVTPELWICAVAKILLSRVWPFLKASIIILSDSNSVVSSGTASSTSTKHHHGTITCTPLTPESNTVPSLNVTITICLAEANSGTIRSFEINRTASQAPVIWPNVSIGKSTITRQETSQSSRTHAIGVGPKQSSVWSVITACYFQLCPPYVPKSLRYHIIVRCCACWWSLWRQNAVPPVRIISHPIFWITIWEPRDKSPTASVCWHVTKSLKDISRYIQLVSSTRSASSRIMFFARRIS